MARDDETIRVAAKIIWSGEPEAYRYLGWRGKRFFLARTIWLRRDAARGPAAGPGGGAGKKGGAGMVRQCAGGPDVPVYFDRRFGMSAQPGVLSGNGAVFAGKKEMMATMDRGEGVHLLPASRWNDYSLPQPLLLRSPGHMRDWVRACKGGEQSVSDFRIAGPYTEWMLLGVIALRVPGKLLWDSKMLRWELKL